MQEIRLFSGVQSYVSWSLGYVTNVREALSPIFFSRATLRAAHQLTERLKDVGKRYNCVPDHIVGDGAGASCMGGQFRNCSHFGCLLTVRIRTDHAQRKDERRHTILMTYLTNKQA